MPEAHDDLRKLRQRRPRLVTWRLGACLLGFAAAGWIWLGSGFAWDATPQELADAGEAPRVAGNWRGRGGWVGRYVRVRSGSAARTWYATERLKELQDDAAWRDYVAGMWGGNPSSPDASSIGHWIVKLREGDTWRGAYAFVEAAGGRPRFPLRGRVSMEGLSARPGWMGKGGPPRSPQLVVDATAGRLDGTALIAVVLAFWSSVFLQLGLVEWLRARRRHESERAELVRAKVSGT